MQLLRHFRLIIQYMSDDPMGFAVCLKNEIIIREQNKIPSSQKEFFLLSILYIYCHCTMCNIILYTKF